MKFFFKKQFKKDVETARSSGLVPTIKKLIAIVINNPFQTPPPYEKLKGEVNTYSRRINQQHRLVYRVNGDKVTFLRCWSHYE